METLKTGMLKNIFSVFCAILMLPAFLSGCTHENPGLPAPDEGFVPKLVIERTEIEVPADTCRLEFSYIIENPVEGAVVEAFDRYASDEEYFLNELEYYRMLASAYGVLFEEYLAGILKHGTLSYQYFNALEPETGQGIFVVCSCRGFVYGHGHFRAEQRAYSPGIFRGGYSHQYVQKRFSAGAFLREVCPYLLIFKNVS